MAQVLNVGTLLDHGKYRVEKILGQGGFGITYLVTDLGLYKLRALKEFFPKELCERDETTSQVMCSNRNTEVLVKRLKAKFLKEARNIANLDRHSGIVSIHTVFEENDTAYYVMDYIEGESLTSLVKREGPLPVERAVKYIREVGEALEYVHAQHINHLDVKPANIMVRREDDKAILIDFGLSKQYDSEGHQTSTTPTGISHGFAPMEQYQAGGVREFSPQTDVYSLAATLYFILTGKIPPQAPYIAENGLDFPSNFPYELRETVDKAMSTQRKKRYESVRQFLNSLQEIKSPARRQIKVEVVDSPKQYKPINQAAKEQNRNKDNKLVNTQLNTPSIEIPKKSRITKIIIASIIFLCLIIIGVVISSQTNNSDPINYKVLSQSDQTDYKILSQTDQTAEISKASTDLKGSVEIPPQIELEGKTYDVTSIGEYAFDGCSSITSITIPNSVTSIGDKAFKNCILLTSVTIPNSVTSIGESAFSNCSSLTNITIPNSVTSIGGYAFYNCTGLTSITIPNSVTSIENDAFWSCTGLTRITIPNSVTSIGGYAFYRCTNLIEVTIPARFKEKIDYIFPVCPNLKPINYTE